MTKCMWASGIKDVWSGFDLFKVPPVEAIFFFIETNCWEQGLCILPQQSVHFRDTAGTFITSNYCNIRSIHERRGWLPQASCLPACRAQWVQTICLRLSITLLSSCWIKREKFLLFSSYAFVVLLSVQWQKESFWRLFWQIKIATCSWVCVNSKLMLTSVCEVLPIHWLTDIKVWSMKWAPINKVEVTSLVLLKN